jgi:hypothetical protein
MFKYIGSTWRYIFSSWYHYIDWWLFTWLISCLIFLAVILGGIMLSIGISLWFIVLIAGDLFFGLPWLRFVISHA